MVGVNDGSVFGFEGDALTDNWGVCIEVSSRDGGYVFIDRCRLIAFEPLAGTGGNTNKILSKSCV